MLECFKGEDSAVCQNDKENNILSFAQGIWLCEKLKSCILDAL